MGYDFAREWPFFPDDEKLRIFEPRANVAVLIGHTAIDVGGVTKVDPPLATILGALPDAVGRAQIAAIGTIATLRDGVERVVQNLITNPYITVLMLCGEDSPVFFPLEGVACLYAHGVDEGRHVVPGNGAARAAKVFARDALATLSLEDIAVFRNRPLEIVDCRGALDPAAFLTDVAGRLPALARPVEDPAWTFLETIDVYRWRPRILQVAAGSLPACEDATVHAAGSTLLLARTRAAAVITADGKSDGRAQRALHTALREGWLGRDPGWEGRLAALTLATERAVLATEFPDDARRIGVDVACAPVRPGAIEGRPSPIRLDPTGFFKIGVRYEQGILAADYHEADGRHVETLHARSADDLLAAITTGEYLGDYADRDQHVVYLAVQIARADFALRSGLRFEEGQPLALDARKNVDHHLAAAAVVRGGSLEETWVRGLENLREHGLLTTTQKGRVAEGWCTLFVIPEMGEISIPTAYPATDEHIAHYAEELLAAAPEVRARGDYTYGDRTCHYFFDQIEAAGRALVADPTRVHVNQRWVPEVDLPATAHHRPCLIFDLWFIHDGRLHTVQVARSHDIYGGLPQNALGVARGWGARLATITGVPLGDLCFLSISNNFRVGDDAENVRKAIQGGVHAPAAAGTLPIPVVTVLHEQSPPEAVIGALQAAGPLHMVHVERLDDAPVGTVADVLAACPAVAERLLRYQGSLNQIETLMARLRAEVEAGGRERTNSLVLSPRDPRLDREREHTPLVCFQLRRQIGALHGAAVVLGPEGRALAPLVLDLQRAISSAVGLPTGSATIACIG